jgi:aryl sulfotransferase
MAERKLYLGLVTDSRRWDHIRLRSDDIIVATPPKSGTTWMQTILALLIQGSTELDPEFSAKRVWVDVRFREIADLVAELDARTDRRILKSHTPLDGLPVAAEPTFITVFRHPLDVHFSFRKHVRNMPTTWFHPFYPEEDPDGFTFRRFLDGGAEGYDTDVTPLAHILRHYRAAMDEAARPNVHVFHYADMTRDLAGTFAKVAEIIGVSHSADVMSELVEAATFESMKQNAEKHAPSGGRGFWKSDSGFFDSGSHGKWHGVLSDAELSAYDRIMDASLSKEERGWLEYGEQRAP